MSRNDFILKEMGAPETSLNEKQCEGIVKRIIAGDSRAWDEWEASLTYPRKAPEVPA